MAEEEIGLRASLKDRAQTAKGLRDIEQGVDRVGDRAEQVGRRARIGAAGMDQLHKAGKLAAVGIGAAFAATAAAGYVGIGLLKDSFGEARESQKVGATTAQIIKTTGRAANVSAVQVGNLTTALSKKAGVDDELIQSGANQLLTFTAVRNEVGKNNKIFDRATTAALNLSKTPGMGDMVGSAKMLGKALQDPLTGLSALHKAGIDFLPTEKAQIASWVAQGDVLSAQRLILGKVEGQVNGVAAAQATWGDKASVSIGNIKENLGTALLPMLDDVERWFVKKGAPQLDHYVGIFQNKGVPAIHDFADAVERRGIPMVKDFVGKARPLAEQILPAVGTSVGVIRDALSTAAPYAADLVGAFNDMPDWAKKAIVGGALAGYAGKKAGAFSLLGSLGKGDSGLLGAITKANPMPVWVVNKSDLANDGLGGKVKNVAKAAAGGGLLTAGVGITAAVAALAADAYFIKKTNPGVKEPESAIADRRAALTRSREATVGIIRPASNYDFNTLLQNQLLAKKYAFDFNTELRLNKANLDIVGKTKPAPRFSAPGLSEAETGTMDLQDRLDVIGRTNASAHVGADTSAANAAIDQLQVRLFGLRFNIGGGSTPTASVSTPKAPKLPKLNAPTAPRVNLDDFETPADGRLSAPSAERREVIEWWMNDEKVAELVVGSVSRKMARQ